MQSDLVIKPSMFMKEQNLDHASAMVIEMGLRKHAVHASIGPRMENAPGVLRAHGLGLTHQNMPGQCKENHLEVVKENRKDEAVLVLEIPNGVRRNKLPPQPEKYH